MRQPALGALPRAQRDEILIVYRNWLLGRNGATVTADSEVAEGNMVAANLLTENRSDFWRSGSVATRAGEATPEIVLTWYLGARRRDVDWSSYHWSNVLVPWRDDYYRGDPDAGGTLLGTTDWVNPIVKSEPADFYFAEFPWSCGPTDEQIVALAADSRLASFCHLAEPIFGVDYVRRRFDVTEGANGLRDYIQMALPFAGRAWQPGINASLGLSLSGVDRSVIARTAGGAAQGITRPTSDELSFSLDMLTDKEGAELFYEWVKTEGSLARVFAWKEPVAKKRWLFYYGGAFVGTAEGFSGLSIEKHEGYAGGIFVAKTAKTIKIQETE